MSSANANPYTPSPVAEDNMDANLPLRGFAKFSCIVFIAFGAIGLTQLVTQLGAFVLGKLSNNAEGVEITPFTGAWIVGIVFVIANLCISTLEIIAGALGLQRKRKGANLMRSIAGGMVFYKLIETAYNAIVWVLITPGLVSESVRKMNAEQLKQFEDNNWDIEYFFTVFFYVIMSLVGALGVVMTIYYLCTFLFFCKPKTIAQFPK